MRRHIPPTPGCRTVSRTHMLKLCRAILQKRLRVYGYLMKHPLSHPPPNLLTSMRVQRRRKRKVGHVCRFNEAQKKALYDKLMFSPPAEPLSSKGRLHSLLTHRHTIRRYPHHLVRVPFSCDLWVVVVVLFFLRLFLGAQERLESLIYCISPQSRLIVFRM